MRRPHRPREQPEPGEEVGGKYGHLLPGIPGHNYLHYTEHRAIQTRSSAGGARAGSVITTGPDLGGAKGARTPDLLVANHISYVFLRRPVSSDEASTCENCR
jgi:hypothetical protein